MNHLLDAGHEAIAITCDVANEKHAAAAVDRAVCTFGRLDMAYNNAGILGPMCPMMEETEEGFYGVTATNLRGVWTFMKHELLQMTQQASGAIVNCSSLGGLVGLPGRAWIDRVHARRPQTTIVLDLDSSVSETHGMQEGSAYNGHYACTCYHPLFVFNQFGDLERCELRSGNVHSADGWRNVLEPVAARYRGQMKRRSFRGYANPGVYEFLESKGDKYTIRLPANAILQERIGWLLKRPVGRPPRDVRRYYASFSYQAASWRRSRRVVAKVEWHPGELYPRIGFIVTTMTRPPERVTLFYNQRGTAEQHIKEGKNAIVWTRLSYHRFAANPVWLQLHALAYNLANFLRSLTLPEAVSHWSMTTLRDRLVKIAAKIVRHGRSIAFQMAEIMVSRGLFQHILDAIAALRPLPPARC